MSLSTDINSQTLEEEKFILKG